MKRTLCLFLALILAVGICFSAPVTITASAAEALSVFAADTTYPYAVVATVTDGSTTLSASDAATLNQAVTAILETGSRTFTVELPADAEAEMITAIRRAICDTEGVEDGSIYLTLKGVITIPGTTNGDGVAFGHRDAQWDENNVEIVSHEEVTQLASINLPDVTEIGAKAFDSCRNLVSVSAPKAQTIGSHAFGHTALTSVEFPELTTIHYGMFAGTRTLSSAKFPKVTTIEQGGLLVGAIFRPENNPTPFPLELTAEGDITFNGSYHFNVESQNYSGKVNLVLCCDKKGAVTSHKDGTATWKVSEDLSYTFKSITFKHSYVDGKCNVCGEDCAHTGGTATCTTLAVCESCGVSYGEFGDHTYKNGKCTVANCDNACAHETITDGVCVACGGKHCGKTETDKVVWFYDEDTTTLTITGSGAMADYTGSDMPWYDYKNNIKTIVINKGVTSIGKYSFYRCKALESVTIGDSVTSIGDNAFDGCTYLETVNVPCDWDTKKPLYAFDENVLEKYHNIVIDEAKAPTCTATGLTEGQHCTRCDAMTIIQEEVPARNHKDTLVQVEAKAKTCTEAGYNAYEYCTACDYTTYVEIPASHELQEEKAKAPTCEAIGWDAYKHCTDCNYTTYVEKAKLGHDIVIDKAKAATCTATGLTEGSHCSRCDDKTVKQDIIPKKGHTEIKGGTEGAHTICDVCEDVLSAEHEFAKIVTKEPTQLEMGVTLYSCSCGYSYEEEIACVETGEIEAEVDKSNSFSASVEDVNSIIAKLQLTDEEKALIEQGADMKIVFKLSDIGATINTPEKEAIFKALTNEKIAVFLDIQLVKQIANSSVNVQKLNDLIKVTVELPAELVNKDGNIKRSYSVLRYHDGDETKVTTLNAKFDEATGTLTFDTDRFSTYAIVYSDVVVSNGEGAPGTPDSGDGEVSTPETPKDETTPGTPETPKDDVSSDKTDDSVTNDKNDASSETGTNDKNDTSKDDVPKAGVISTTSIWIGAMALSGFGALLVSKKKKEND